MRKHLSKCRPEEAEIHTMLTEISELYADMPWFPNVETSVWEMTQNRSAPRDLGNGVVSEEAIEILRDLSKKTGGWFIGDEFVTLYEWKEIYAEFMRQREESFAMVRKQFAEIFGTE